MGDARLNPSSSVLNWAKTPYASAVTIGSATATRLPELDYITSTASVDAFGVPAAMAVTKVTTATGCNFAGNDPSSAFAMAVSLETTNGVEISGLNAEEQSDISLLANWSQSQQTGFGLEVYSYYDAMIILRENNVLELIQ
jgi:hypothetical protein